MTFMSIPQCGDGNARMNPIHSSHRDYLDVALRDRDQRMLSASSKIPLKLKSALRNNINRKHPAAPVDIPRIWGANDNAASALATNGLGDATILVVKEVTT